MTGNAQQLTAGTTGLTKGRLVAALVRAMGDRPDRPRPISEILDLGRTFVAGFPQHVADDRQPELG